MTDRQHTSQWQPIETAPTDGSNFLARTKHGTVCVMNQWEEDRIVRSITCRRCDGMGLGDLVYWAQIPEFI